MKALFFDIDGTLIDIKSHQIPTSTMVALKEAKARGHRIFIATGRSHTIVELPGLSKEIIDGYVTLNGAVCLAGQKAISLVKIPKSMVRKLSEICIAHDFTCLFVTMDGMKVANENDKFETGFRQYFNLKPIPTTDFSMMQNMDVYQMTVFLTEEMEQELKPMFPELEFNRWFPTFADITYKGVNKSKGIKAIAEYFNIDMRDTIAFGDGGNDIPMLKCAGIGVAMGNASAEVKSSADIVTDAVDKNGIYNILCKLKIIRGNENNLSEFN